MDHRRIDRLILLVYAVVVVVSAIFIRVAVGPLAIFGAFAVALWFSVIRPAMKARERERARRDGTAPPPLWE